MPPSPGTPEKSDSGFDFPAGRRIVPAKGFDQPMMPPLPERKIPWKFILSASVLIHLQERYVVFILPVEGFLNDFQMGCSLL